MEANKSERQKEEVVEEKSEGSSYVDDLYIETLVKHVFEQDGVAIGDDFNFKQILQNKYGPHQIEHLKKIIMAPTDKHNNYFDFDPKIAVAANMVFMKGNEEALPKGRFQELRYKFVYDMVAADVRENKKDECLYKIVGEHLELKNSYEQLQKASDEKIRYLEKNLEDLRAQLKLAHEKAGKDEDAAEGNVMKKARNDNMDS